MITREFNLYLHAGHSIPLVINVNQYDRGESWVFTLFNSDGTQYVPSSGAIVGIKSDNLGIINTATVDSQGRVVINETQQMTAAVGKAVFELVIDDGTHGTANFVVLVEEKPGNNADLSESDISMIEEAIEAASTIKPYGSPLVASTVAGMTDHEKVYVYVGSETGYTSGNWYYWDGSAWTSGGVYNSVAVQTDTTLALSGVAADAKKTGDEITDLKSQIDQGSVLTQEEKDLMLALFKGALYDSDLSDTVNTLETLWAESLSVIQNIKNVSSSFNGTSVNRDDPLTITLTANSGFELIGVTVLMGGIDITSSAYSNGTISIDSVTGVVEITSQVKGSGGLLYSWDFTNGLTDSVNGKVAEIGFNDGTGQDSSYTYGTELPTLDSNGLTFTGNSQDCKLGKIFGRNRAYEIDVASMTAQWDTNAHARLMMFGSDTYAETWVTEGVRPSYGLIWKKTSTIGWAYYSDKGVKTNLDYANGTWTNITALNGSTSAIKNYFSGHTVKVVISSTGVPSLYIDGTLLETSSGATFSNKFDSVYLGSNARKETGGQVYTTTITGFRVYDLSV